MPPAKLPKIPRLIDRKIYKTGQTRGADDDEIYQNRVSRNSTVLIPFRCWPLCNPARNGGQTFESGFIVLISPDEYFNNDNIQNVLRTERLVLGTNALIFYETREQWDTHNPLELGWAFATSRTAPLGGNFVARISATTAAENGTKINYGFTQTANKGAGIRAFEYASSESIKHCRLQLEAFLWMCEDSIRVAVANGMTQIDAEHRRNAIIAACEAEELLDHDRLIEARILNANRQTVCPLCLEELSSEGFFNRMEQAEGREVLDLTITQLNLFHIKELRYGVQNHRPYNLGWGHHHCNVVVKDMGIIETLEWMQTILHRNIQSGYLSAVKSAS